MRILGAMKRSLLVPTLASLCVVGACSSSGTPVSVTSDAGGTEGGGGGDGGGQGGDAAIVSKCAPVSGEGTTHNKDIFADETWGPGLHVVTFTISVSKKATLTLAPCAVVRFTKDTGMFVGGASEGEDGVLVAEGKADEPIVIEGTTTDKWKDIQVYPKGQARLRFVTLRGGGGPTSRNGATLHLYGDANKPAQALAKVESVTIEDSGKYGLFMETRGALSADSTGLTIRGSGDMPMRVSGATVSSVPPGNYTGNKNDTIRLAASAGYDVVADDQTIHDRGVPYFIGGDGALNELTIQGPTTPVLTIEAGVTLRFPKSTGSSGVWIDRSSSDVPAKGVLKVLGTAQKPVVFTSAEASPAAGDWIGLVFGGIPSANDKVEFARIDFAGGDTGIRNFSCGTPGSDDVPSNEAGIILLGKPVGQFVTNTTIANSAKNGIERGWFGDSIDFLPTNKFENIAFCTQTLNRPQVGICPDPPPCPK